MPNISGSFTADITADTTLFPEDQPNHQVQLAQIHATRKSPDPSWNNARLTYYGVTDLVAGGGKQHGYFVNEHLDGDSDRGLFEGRVTTAGSQTTVEGTFTIDLRNPESEAGITRDPGADNERAPFTRRLLASLYDELVELDQKLTAIEEQGLRRPSRQRGSFSCAE